MVLVSGSGDLIYTLRVANRNLQKEVTHLTRERDELIIRMLHYYNKNIQLKKQIAELEKEVTKLGDPYPRPGPVSTNVISREEVQEIEKGGSDGNGV